jgi:hypothetical protein
VDPYGTTSDDIRLVRFDSAATTIGTVVHVAAAGVGMALASQAPVSSVNPLGIVWQDRAAAPSPTTHFVEVSSTEPFSAGTSLGLPGGTSGIPGPGNVEQIVAAPNGSVGIRSGHWFVASSLHAWDVLGNAGAPTATAWTPLDAVGAETMIAINGGGRMAYATGTYDAVTRRIGCR